MRGPARWTAGAQLRVHGRACPRSPAIRHRSPGLAHMTGTERDQHLGAEPRYKGASSPGCRERDPFRRCTGRVGTRVRAGFQHPPSTRSEDASRHAICTPTVAMAAANRSSSSAGRRTGPPWAMTDRRRGRTVSSPATRCDCQAAGTGGGSVRRQGREAPWTSVSLVRSRSWWTARCAPCGRRRAGGAGAAPAERRPGSAGQHVGGRVVGRGSAERCRQRPAGAHFAAAESVG